MSIRKQIRFADRTEGRQRESFYSQSATGCNRQIRSTAFGRNRSFPAPFLVAIVTVLTIGQLAWKLLSNLFFSLTHFGVLI